MKTNNKLVLIILIFIISMITGCFFDEQTEEINGLNRHDVVLEGQDKWLFYLPNNSLGYYQGTNIMTDYETRENFAVVNLCNKVCSEKGKTLIFMVMPNKNVVYDDKMPEIPVYYEQGRIECFFDYISKHSNIITVYPFDDLQKAKENYQVYYSHDTHWNHCGGYIGTQALYKVLGYSTSDFKTWAPVEDNLVTGGDLINLGNLESEDYPGDVDYYFDYRPEITYSSYVDEGDYLSATVENAEHNCSIVLLGDSFRINMIPVLTKDFSKCTIVNRGILYDPKTIQALKEADVIVISAVERFSDAIMDNAKSITEILY